MTAARRLPAPVETLGVLLACLAAIYLAMLPLGGPVGRLLPMPDLAFCLVLAWVARRPREAPVWAIVAAGLAADLLLMRPPGLGALALLLAAAATRANAQAVAAGPFLAEWLGAAALAFAAALGMQAALELTFADAPALRPLLLHAAATAAAYPLAVLLLALLLGIRRPRRARHAERLGRLG